MKTKFLFAFLIIFIPLIVYSQTFFKSYEYGNCEHGYATEAYNSGYLITGISLLPFGGSGLVLIRINNNGDTLWSKRK
jgi:hypothetical protein